MSTLPNFTGPGYFAGEAPDGLTTVAGVPVAAQVQVLWRDSADPAATETLVAQTTSSAGGQWQITGLNPDLQYVVRGRKMGFDDVTVVGAVPTRTDVVTATGSFATNADKNGVDGSVLIEASRSGPYHPKSIRAFEHDVLKPLLALNIQPLERSKSAIGGDCVR